MPQNCLNKKRIVRRRFQFGLSVSFEQNSLASLRRFKAVLCIEEHQINGGLSSLLAPLFAADLSLPPFERMGVNRKFGESMDTRDLYDFLELSEQDIFNKLNQLAA